MGIFSSFFKKENSKEDAKNRLKLVLIQDRAMLPSGVLDNMKDDILKVLSKYVEIEKSKLNIEVCPYDDDPRKIALVANIPILKSDSGIYIEALGGLPGPYNHYFDKQIGVEKFLELFKNETNRKVRLEHCFAYCEPGEEPIVFSGGGTGTISYEARGTRGRWHDKFYIPDGETKTLSELREIDYEKEATYWGDAKDQFAKWYKEKYLN